jgi:hypothetical protein
MFGVSKLAVFVVDKRKKPLMTCSERRVRLLLERGRAVVHHLYPFTVTVRLVLSAAAALICSEPGPLAASEAVRLPMSCSYVANRVVLAPSSREETLAIVGEREHKTIRVCAPGLLSQCRSWEVHRFDVLCGSRPVSWHVIAGHILNAPGPARREMLLRARLAPWEVRILLAETEFAPVDEIGGQILPFSDNPMPQGGSDAAGAKPEVIPPLAPPKPEPANPVADAPPSLPRADQQAPGATAQQPTMPLPGGEQGTDADKAAQPAAGGDAGPGNVMVLDKPVGKSATRVWNSLASRLPSALAYALPMAVILVMIFAAIRWRKGMAYRLLAPFRSRGRPAPGVEEEPAVEPDDGVDAAQACRDLMKQITQDLVKAMSAVNGLKGAPALQTALYTELNSIRRSVGFTSQTRDAAGGDKDWIQIRSELALSLQGTRRIIDIADAAQTSFSAHPAALEVITTRLEAYAFLGVNANASETALKKAVNALRQCWHPDLATDEEDRRLREIRIKQINAAWDLISGKQPA